MKKWIMYMLLLGMFCMMSGCRAKEDESMEKQEFSDSISHVKDEDDKKADIKKGGKYEGVLEGNISEVIEKDLETLGSYELTSMIGFDENSIENYLEGKMYGNWYKEGENTPIEMSATKFDEKEYGVYYVIRVYEEGYEGYEAFGAEIIKLYEIGDEENPFYMVISDSYEYREDGSVLTYSYMSLHDAEGEQKGFYQSVPQQELDAIWENIYDDYSVYDGEYVDGFVYKVEASATNNCNYTTYRDILRNPTDYYGVKAYTRGTVTWSGDGVFMLETIGGLIYIVYRGEGTENVIRGDSCIIFGEFDGTGEYTTTNEYGVTTTHTAVAIYAPYTITDQENGTPCDPRMIELLYGTYDENKHISIDENTIGIVGSNTRYEYSVTFGNVEVSTGHYYIPITLSYYIPEDNLTVTAVGKFSPWERGLWWNEADSEKFFFYIGTGWGKSWCYQIEE